MTRLADAPLPARGEIRRNIRLHLSFLKMTILPIIFWTLVVDFLQKSVSKIFIGYLLFL